MLGSRKTCDINDSVGMKLLTRLPLAFGYLRECKFKLDLRDVSNSLFLVVLSQKLQYYMLRY